MNQENSKSQLTLNLTAFQGPFDLLLHLIREMEIDIYDIPMAEITQQYLVYVHEMQELDLDMAGDYLVMAATLIEIKSRLLLPVEEEFMDQLDEDQDPRYQLVQQLLVYQQFQIVADALEHQQDMRSQVFSRPMTDLSHFQEAVPLEEGEVSLDQLSQTMSRILTEQIQRQPQEKAIRHDTVSVTDKIKAIEARFVQHNCDEPILFDDLLDNYQSPEIIATFMAILEMVKKQVLVFKQTNNLASIQIQLKEVTHA